MFVAGMPEKREIPVVVLKKKLIVFSFQRLSFIVFLRSTEKKPTNAPQEHNIGKRKHPAITSRRHAIEIIGTS